MTGAELERHVMALSEAELESVGIFCRELGRRPWRTVEELRRHLAIAAEGLPLAHLGAIVAAAEALRGAR